MTPNDECSGMRTIRSMRCRCQKGTSHLNLNPILVPVTTGSITHPLFFHLTYCVTARPTHYHSLLLLSFLSWFSFSPVFSASWNISCLGYDRNRQSTKVSGVSNPRDSESNTVRRWQAYIKSIRYGAKKIHVFILLAQMNFLGSFDIFSFLN